jgi:hypothetical protein
MKVLGSVYMVFPPGPIGMMYQFRVGVLADVTYGLIIGHPYVPPKEGETYRTKGGNDQGQELKEGEPGSPGFYVPGYGGKQGGDNGEPQNRQNKVPGRKQKHEQDDKKTADPGADHVPKINLLYLLPQGHKGNPGKNGDYKKRKAVNNIIGPDKP